MHVIICPLLHLWWITRHTRGFLLSYARKRSQGVNQLIWVAIQSIVEDFSDSIFKMTELLVLWCTGLLMDKHEEHSFLLAPWTTIDRRSPMLPNCWYFSFLSTPQNAYGQSFLACCTKSGKASFICGICCGPLMWNWFLFYANSATPKMKIGKNVNNIEL